MGSQAAEDRDRIVDYLDDDGEWTTGIELGVWLERTLRLTPEQGVRDLRVLLDAGRIERERTAPEGVYPPRYRYRAVRP